jgi:hypothetical protein
MPSDTDTAREDPPAEARYANCFNVGYNAFEVLLEFGQLYHEDQQPRFHTRIVTSPSYARELLRTLQRSLNEYDDAYGKSPGPGGESE